MFIHFLERPGVGPLRVRMVLAERYVRKGRAMQLDERPRGPLTAFVNGGGDELFSRTRVTCQKNIGA